MERTFGEKLKSARKSAGLTQEQPAEKLVVSRQAITKWESDRGMPDIENLKMLAKTLDVSIDHLLDSGESIDLTVIREPISLDDFDSSVKPKRLKKLKKKNIIVTDKFPNSDIHRLLATQILTKKEKLADNIVGFLLNGPFGVPDFINSLKNMDKEFYLVNQTDKQFLVVVTDEFIESRQLAVRITEKKFKIGEYSFIDCGSLSKN